MFLLVFAGCSQKTVDVSLPLEPPGYFSYSGEDTVPDKWWTVFDDPDLNVLIDSALSSNFNIRSAWENLRAARFIVDRESSALFPSVEASLQGGIDYPQPDYVGGESFRFGLRSEYEVDLWGRIRSSIEAEQYLAQAGFSDYRATALLLSAEIVRTWFALGEAKKQQELINEQIDVNEQMLRLLRARLGSGLIRSVDVLRQKQLIESNYEQRIQVENEVNILENELNVLLGRFPRSSFSALPDSLPNLPPLPETGVPANLVMRRPDVQAAYNRLLAADRDLATAVSSKYPRFSLTASASVRANNVNQLFEEWAYSLAGNILAPLFRGGALNAEANRAEAVKNQLLYEYAQTVLIAFREVEDALVREINQRERIQSLQTQADLADKAYRQLRLEYFNGMANYIDVLTALNQQQQLQRTLLAESLTMFMIRTALYRALAGGFETPVESRDN
ncbi:MAG: efflux transporter outer membrane subunit [Mariniphaga sp.]